MKERFMDSLKRLKRRFEEKRLQRINKRMKEYISGHIGLRYYEVQTLESYSEEGAWVIYGASSWLGGQNVVFSSGDEQRVLSYRSDPMYRADYSLEEHLARFNRRLGGVMDDLEREGILDINNCKEKMMNLLNRCEKIVIVDTSGRRTYPEDYYFTVVALRLPYIPE